MTALAHQSTSGLNRWFIVYMCFAVSLMAQLPVEQGRFDLSLGFQTQQMNDSPYTNYFSVRATSTNYIFLEDYTASFGTLEAGFVVTNDWYGGFNGWTTVTNRTQQVKALTPGSGSFSLQFTNLQPGLYGVQIFGVVTNVVTTTWRLPLLWKIQVNDAADGTTNTYHLIQNYITNRCYDVGQFWIQALQPTNNILATVSLDGMSEVSCNVVALHFFTFTDFTDRNIYKTNATLYTAEEHAARIEFGSTNAAAETVLNWKNGSPALPTLTGATLTNTFNKWMPINQQWDEQGGTYITNQFGTNRWFLFPYYANYQYYLSDFSPWGWTNIATAGSFTLANSLAGITVASANDFNGFFYTNSYWVSSYGAGQFSYSRDWMLANLQDQNQTSLGQRYYTFPSATNAHVAGLIFAKFALAYPTYRLEVNDINSNVKNPSAYLDYNYGRWSLRRTGKLEYDGWAGTSQGYLAQQLDFLWPYVSTSAAFATDLTKFIPWIASNTNNVKLFFEQNVLRSLYFDAGYRARGGDPMQLGVVMQSGSTASNLMNPAEAELEITPATATAASWKKQYAGTYNQDGVNLIGSSFYMVGENPLLDGPDLTRRYIANGGQVGAIDISDATDWPKLEAFVDWYAEQQVGYNYSASFGDAAQSINEGPGIEGSTDDAFLVGLWRLKNNSRLGKYIYDVRGRTSQTDAEWATMGVQSAATALDIRWPVRSRIFIGVGIASLERGLGTTNQLQRGAMVMRTVSGYGHDHGDHLDLNIYAFGSRMGTDFGQRNEVSLLVYPNDTASGMHNVVAVDGYNHLTSTGNGWPGGNTEGGFSGYTAFSTNGSAQMTGADLWNGASHTNVNWQHRDSVLVKIDETNSYAVDFQRIHDGKFYAWSFHGPDVGGESAGFTISQTLTNVTDFTDFAATSPGFFMRKHATNAAYPVQSLAMNTNKLWVEWRLGRTATSAGTLLNYDGNGGAVTAIAPEQAMFGANYSAGSARKYLRATLFDRTNDLVGTAWAFSPNYDILQGRVYVFTPATTYYTNLAERSGAWAALYDPYLGTRVVTSETSIATDNALTNAFMPKVIEVVTPAGTDRHYSSGTNVDVVAGGDTFNATYAFARGTSEFKLVGGTKLIRSGVSLTTSTNNLAVAIASVNYTNRTLITTHPLPVRKIGWYRIRNSAHETSYYISAWSTPTNASFVGDALVSELDVTSVSGNTITFASAEGGMVLAHYPKRGTGLTGMNEARSKIFKSDYAAGTTATRTSGDTPVTGDFTDVDGDGHISAWLYDFGAGDTIETLNDIYVVQNGNNYTVAANDAFTFSAASGVWSIGGQSVTNGVIPATALTGELQELRDTTPTTVLSGSSSITGNVSMQ